MKLKLNVVLLILCISHAECGISNWFQEWGSILQDGPRKLDKRQTEVDTEPRIVAAEIERNVPGEALALHDVERTSPASGNGVKTKRCPVAYPERVGATRDFSLYPLLGSRKEIVESTQPGLHLTRRDLLSRTLINNRLCASCRGKKPCRVSKKCDSCDKFCSKLVNDTIHSQEEETSTLHNGDMTTVTTLNNEQRPMTEEDVQLSSRFKDEEADESPLKKIYPIGVLRTGDVKEVICKLLGISDPSEIDSLVIWATTKSNGSPMFMRGYKKTLNPEIEKLTRALNDELNHAWLKKKSGGGSGLTNIEIAKIVETFVSKVPSIEGSDHNVVTSTNSGMSENAHPDITNQARFNDLDYEDVLPPYPINSKLPSLSNRYSETLPRNPSVIQDVPPLDVLEAEHTTATSDRDSVFNDTPKLLSRHILQSREEENIEMGTDGSSTRADDNENVLGESDPNIIVQPKELQNFDDDDTDESLSSEEKNTTPKEQISIGPSKDADISQQPTALHVEDEHIKPKLDSANLETKIDTTTRPSFITTLQKLRENHKKLFTTPRSNWFKKPLGSQRQADSVDQSSLDPVSGLKIGSNIFKTVENSVDHSKGNVGNAEGVNKILENIQSLVKNIQGGQNWGGQGHNNALLGRGNLADAVQSSNENEDVVNKPAMKDSQIAHNVLNIVDNSLANQFPPVEPNGMAVRSNIIEPIEQSLDEPNIVGAAPGINIIQTTSPITQSHYFSNHQTSPVGFKSTEPVADLNENIVGNNKITPDQVGSTLQNSLDDISITVNDKQITVDPVQKEEFQINVHPRSPFEENVVTNHNQLLKEDLRQANAALAEIKNMITALQEQNQNKGAPPTDPQNPTLSSINMYNLENGRSKGSGDAQLNNAKQSTRSEILSTPQKEMTQEIVKNLKTLQQYFLNRAQDALDMIGSDEKKMESVRNTLNQNVPTQTSNIEQDFELEHSDATKSAIRNLKKMPQFVLNRMQDALGKIDHTKFPETPSGLLSGSYVQGINTDPTVSNEIPDTTTITSPNVGQSIGNVNTPNENTEFFTSSDLNMEATSVNVDDNPVSTSPILAEKNSIPLQGEEDTTNTAALVKEIQTSPAFTTFSKNKFKNAEYAKNNIKSRIQKLVEEKQASKKNIRHPVLGGNKEPNEDSTTTRKSLGGGIPTLSLTAIDQPKVTTTQRNSFLQNPPFKKSNPLMDENDNQLGEDSTISHGQNANTDISTSPKDKLQQSLDRLRSKLQVPKLKPAQKSEENINATENNSEQEELHTKSPIDAESTKNKLEHSKNILKSKLQKYWENMKVPKEKNAFPKGIQKENTLKKNLEFTKETGAMTESVPRSSELLSSIPTNDDVNDIVAPITGDIPRASTSEPPNIVDVSEFPTLNSRLNEELSKSLTVQKSQSFLRAPNEETGMFIQGPNKSGNRNTNNPQQIMDTFGQSRSEFSNFQMNHPQQNIVQSENVKLPMNLDHSFAADQSRIENVDNFQSIFPTSDPSIKDHLFSHTALPSKNGNKFFRFESTKDPGSKFPVQQEDFHSQLSISNLNTSPEEKAIETEASTNKFESQIPGLQGRATFPEDEEDWSSSLGKIVHSSSRPRDVFFVGNGIKLPLQVQKNHDGSVGLSVDVQKLCSCKNSTNCPKTRTEVEKTVSKILKDEEALLKDQLDFNPTQGVEHETTTYLSNIRKGRETLNILQTDHLNPHKENNVFKRSPKYPGNLQFLPEPTTLSFQNLGDVFISPKITRATPNIHDKTIENNIKKLKKSLEQSKRMSNNFVQPKSMFKTGKSDPILNEIEEFKKQTQHVFEDVKEKYEKQAEEVLNKINKDMEDQSRRIAADQKKMLFTPANIMEKSNLIPYDIMSTPRNIFRYDKVQDLKNTLEKLNSDVKKYRDENEKLLVKGTKTIFQNINGKRPNKEVVEQEVGIVNNVLSWMKDLTSDSQKN